MNKVPIRPFSICIEDLQISGWLDIIENLTVDVLLGEDFIN